MNLNGYKFYCDMCLLKHCDIHIAIDSCNGFVVFATVIFIQG